MGTLKKAGLVAVFAGVGIIAGCGGGGTYYYAGVTTGPPAPLVYGPVGIAPAPGYIWTDGFYNWRGGTWVWVPGRWVRPPYPHARWVRPYYQRQRHGYRMHPGHWSRR